MRILHVNGFKEELVIFSIYKLGNIYKITIICIIKKDWIVMFEVFWYGQISSQKKKHYL